MPLEAELEPGEEIILSESLPAPKKGGAPFSIAVSNRALFLPHKKRFAVADPWYFKKVPISQIERVQVRAHKPAWLWLVALLMVGGGIGGLFLVWSSGELKSNAKLVGYSLAFIAVGCAIPWAMRSRVQLIVEMTRGRFTWTPTLTIGGTYSADSRRFLAEVANACSLAGIPVGAPESAV